MKRPRFMYGCHLGWKDSLRTDGKYELAGIGVGSSIENGYWNGYWNGRMKKGELKMEIKIEIEIERIENENWTRLVSRCHLV